eukprot:Em0004g1399a
MEKRAEDEKDEYDITLNYIARGSYPQDATKQNRCAIRKRAKQYRVQDGQLYRVICSDSKNGDALSLYIKDAKTRKQIINGCHIGLAGNHEGRDRTLAKIAQKYFWPGLSKDVRIWVQHCDQCQKTKRKFDHPAEGLHPVPVPNSSWKQIGIDLIGPLPTTTNEVDDNIVDEVEELDNSDSECAGEQEAANGKGMGDSVHHEENDNDKEQGCQNEEQQSHSPEQCEIMEPVSVLEEQLYSPNILHLWRSGACTSYYEAKEDDEEFDNAELDLQQEEYALSKVSLWIDFRKNEHHPPPGTRLGFVSQLVHLLAGPAGTKTPPSSSPTPPVLKPFIIRNPELQPTKVLVMEKVVYKGPNNEVLVVREHCTHEL